MKEIKKKKLGKKKKKEKKLPLSTVWYWRRSILLFLQQHSLPSQTVTNSHRPPRNSLFLRNHWGLAGNLLPAPFGCFLLFPAWEALSLQSFSYACTPDTCSQMSVLCCSPQRKKNCHCSPPAATFPHPTCPGLQSAGEKTRQSDSIPFSYQSNAFNHTLPSQE